MINVDDIFYVFYCEKEVTSLPSNHFSDKCNKLNSISIVLDGQTAISYMICWN